MIIDRNLTIEQRVAYAQILGEFIGNLGDSTKKTMEYLMDEVSMPAAVAGDLCAEALTSILAAHVGAIVAAIERAPDNPEHAGPEYTQAIITYVVKEVAEQCGAMAVTNVTDHPNTEH